MVEAHVAPQLHQRAVGLLCPAAGAAVCLGQRIATLFHPADGLTLRLTSGSASIRRQRCAPRRPPPSRSVHLLS